MKKEPGVDVPRPGKEFRPMRREANPWPSSGLTGAMTEYRTVQDFGAPQGWPPKASASAERTASATDPGRPSMSDALGAVATTITPGPRRRLPR